MSGKPFISIVHDEAESMTQILQSRVGNISGQCPHCGERSTMYWNLLANLMAAAGIALATAVPDDSSARKETGLLNHTPK